VPPPSTTQSHLWLCHWERIDGPVGRAGGDCPLVWICEQPYRTLRLDGPSEDCAGCPVWEALRQARSRRRLVAAAPGKSRHGGGHAA